MIRIFFKHLTLLCLCCLASGFLALGQTNFDDYFLKKTLRMDYVHAGSDTTEFVFLDQIKEEPFWGGSLTKLIDTFNFGDYRVLVRDSVTGKTLYTRGYSTLFREWQATPEAKRICKSFVENVVIPLPKHTVRLSIESRNRKNVFTEIFSVFVNPADPFVVKNLNCNFEVQRLHGKRDPSVALDVVILAEGYTASEMDKFVQDANRFVGYFFTVEPFASRTDAVNFWAVLSPSVESGTDYPNEGKWANTVLNSNFYTFYTDRYLTTQDMKRVRDVAALAPYDQIYILVNSKTYGGGGIYNFYNLCASDMDWASEVFTHEFGHAFAALADEYAYDDTPAELMFDLDIEPWAANLSTLAKGKPKWSDLILAGTQIPTQNEQADKVGAFEGAGLSLHKLYRPCYDCKMRTNNCKLFCQVCLRTVQAMLDFYTK
jgi:hypothetical protein